METTDLTQKLAAIFAEVFDISADSVHPELGPEQVTQWDSLGHVRLVSAIEQAFSCQLEIEEVMAFTNFGTIVKVLATRYQQQA